MGAESWIQDRLNRGFWAECTRSLLLISCYQVEDARNKLHEADAVLIQKAREAENKVSNFTSDKVAQAEESAKQARKDANSSIDNFDKTVERKAAEAKSGIASWFGFK